MLEDTVTLTIEKRTFLKAMSLLRGFQDCPEDMTQTHFLLFLKYVEAILRQIDNGE